MAARPYLSLALALWLAFMVLLTVLLSAWYWSPEFSLRIQRLPHVHIQSELNPEPPCPHPGFKCIKR